MMAAIQKITKTRKNLLPGDLYMTYGLLNVHSDAFLGQMETHRFFTPFIYPIIAKTLPPLTKLGQISN